MDAPADVDPLDELVPFGEVAFAEEEGALDDLILFGGGGEGGVLVVVDGEELVRDGDDGEDGLGVIWTRRRR